MHAFPYHMFCQKCICMRGILLYTVLLEQAVYKIQGVCRLEKLRINSVLEVGWFVQNFCLVQFIDIVESLGKWESGLIGELQHCNVWSTRGSVRHNIGSFH